MEHLALGYTQGDGKKVETYPHNLRIYPATLADFL
jgi:hypothetical protein